MKTRSLNAKIGWLFGSGQELLALERLWCLLYGHVCTERLERCFSCGLWGVGQAFHAMELVWWLLHGHACTGWQELSSLVGKYLTAQGH